MVKYKIKFEIITCNTVRHANKDLALELATINLKKRLKKAKIAVEPRLISIEEV